MKIMKKIIVFLCLVVIACIPFLSVFAALTVTGVQYGETYYAGLSKQYDRLTSIKEPKVIVVGGSNIAFGLDSRLFEEHFGMPSVCFGLYGSLGVKVMMDISKANINKGDIVVLAPECTPEGYSLYFGAESVLKATEGRLDILSHVAFDNAEELLAATWGFAATKIRNARTNETFDLTGVYQNKNINAYGEVDKTVFPREGNVLPTGYLQEAINLSASGLNDEFVDYVNDYAAYCRFRGADVYFSFAPMNERAVTVEKEGKTLRDVCSDFYTELSEKLTCPVISDPMDYIYDYRYFYDTNFHLNDSGVVLRTAQLVRDLKMVQEDYSKTDIALPEPPAPIYQQKDIDMTLNYTSSDLFEYSEEDGYLSIIGVKDGVKDLTSIILPVVHDNKYIVSIRKGALKDLTALQTVTVPVGYTQIDNAVFEGCTSLRKIRILEKNPENIAVFDNLMDGAPDECKIYVVNGTASNFSTGYFWRRYVDRLITGEGV